MAQDEFNEKSARDTVREILGLPPAPPMTPQETAALDRILRNLKDARAKDPDFDKKMRDAWVKAEAAADPDDFDDLSPKDIQQMLKDAVVPKGKAAVHKIHKRPKFRSK